MATDVKQNLNAAISGLPAEIKDWLGSEQATYLIIDLNKKLGLQGAKMTLIPNLILKVATQELAPENFIAELGKALNVNEPVAKNLAEEIETKIFRPIEPNLVRDLGIDVKIMFLNRPAFAPAAAAQPVPIPAAIPSESAPLPAQSLPVAEIKNQLINPAPEVKTPVQEVPAESETPFFLYQETELPVPAQSKIKSRDANPPPNAAPQSDESQNSSRVVHYSNFRTPLNNPGKNIGN